MRTGRKGSHPTMHGLIPNPEDPATPLNAQGPEYGLPAADFCDDVAFGGSS